MMKCKCNTTKLSAVEFKNIRVMKIYRSRCIPPIHQLGSRATRIETKQIPTHDPFDTCELGLDSSRMTNCCKRDFRYLQGSF